MIPEGQTILTHAEALGRVHALARAHWPSITLDVEVFATHAVTVGATAEAIERNGKDLYLAAACLAGVRTALHELDVAYLARVGRSVARLGRSSDFPQEVEQLLREKLLTTDKPKLLSYVGRGPLVEWLRAVAIRTALNLGRSDRRTILQAHPAQIMADVLPVQPESEAFKARHRQDFQRAIEAAFARLAAHDRTLLRLHFIDQVGIDRLGVIYGVHRATVARWLLRLRQQMLDCTEAALAAHLGWSKRMVHSTYRLFQDELHVSVSRLLGAAAVSGPGS